jgi:thiol-disulfide isomerase/thioredoxin
MKRSPHPSPARRRWLLGTLALLALRAQGASAQHIVRPWPAERPVPPLGLADLYGRTWDLAALKGRPVLLNFWATWCEPCREEMPSIERLRTQLQRRPFAVLAVNVGQSAEAARAFAKTMPLGFPLLLDRDMRTSRAWGARVLPATFLIGPDGVARYSYFGELDWSKPEVRAEVEKLMR